MLNDCITWEVYFLQNSTIVYFYISNFYENHHPSSIDWSSLIYWFRQTFVRSLYNKSTAAKYIYWNILSYAPYAMST